MTEENEEFSKKNANIYCMVDCLICDYTKRKDDNSFVYPKYEFNEKVFTIIYKRVKDNSLTKGLEFDKHNIDRILGKMLWCAYRTIGIELESIRIGEQRKSGFFLRREICTDPIRYHQNHNCYINNCPENCWGDYHNNFYGRHFYGNP